MDSWAKGCWDKFLRRQCWAIEIPTGQPGPTHAKFPRHTDRDGLQVVVEEIDLGVGQGATDGDAPVGVAEHTGIVAGNVRGHFGRTVEVEQQAVWQALLKVLDKLQRQGFTATDPDLERW